MGGDVWQWIDDFLEGWNPWYGDYNNADWIIGTISSSHPSITVGAGSVPAVVGPNTSLPPLVPAVTDPTTGQILEAPVVDLRDLETAEGENMSFIDDADWFDQMYGIADTALGGWLPGGPVSPFDPPTPGVPVAPGIVPPLTAVPVPGVTFPAPLTGTVGTTCSTGPKPVYKMVCGVYKWVYPKRRRRKALVTKQDAAGLAVLKGIVGVGKTMDTWIATHS